MVEHLTIHKGPLRTININDFYIEIENSEDVYIEIDHTRIELNSPSGVKFKIYDIQPIPTKRKL